MKKTILSTLLSSLLIITIIHANNAETKPKIDYMAEIMKMEKEIQAEKKETASAIKVNKKLDELKGVIVKKNLQNKK